MSIAIALIGYGRWGENIARVIANNPRFALKAIADTDPMRLALAGVRHPGADLFADVRSAIMSKEIDAVAIATPPLTLTALVRTALAERRHVFVEKPGTGSVAEARALAEAAKHAGVTLMIDLTAVWSPLQDALAGVLGRGAAGRLVSWRAERINNGAEQPGINVLRDLAIHDFAALDALIPGRPLIVEATGAATEDGRISSARIQLTYADEFAAEISASWTGQVQRRRTVIVGSDATLSRDDAIGGDGVRLGQNGSSISVAETPQIGSLAEPLARAIDGFADAIEKEIPPRTSMQRAVRVLRWIDAAERSIAANGRSMSLDC